MKNNKIKLTLVGLAMVLLFSLSSVANSIGQLNPPIVEHEIFSDTIVGSDPFAEGLELVAGEGEALIAQYYQFGGAKSFPLDPSHSSFEDLEFIYIISSNQENWHKYWPRTIWEFRDGATVVLQYSKDLEDSLTAAEDIINALSQWMNTTLDILYGASVGSQTTLFYWGYLSQEQHSAFITNEFYDVFSDGGFNEFITADAISSAPVSVVGTGLIKNATDEWVPLAISAFILEHGIAINETSEEHTLSIRSAFDYDGQIQGGDSLYSKITFTLPYVANVYNITKTDNLYPELTGVYEWTVKAGEWINKTYDDIYVIYDMKVEELQTFPQISADLSVDVTELHSDTDPKLNYTITMDNTGNEKAYNVTFVWDLGEKPEPEYVYIFNSEEYEFNSTLVTYFNYSSGKLVDELVYSVDRVENNGSTTYYNKSLMIMGWFTDHYGNVVQPITTYNSTTGLYSVDMEATINSVYINKSFLNFVHSANLEEITLDNGNFALRGFIDELDNGSSETFWWGMDDLPASDDTFIILGKPNVTWTDPPYSNDSGIYYDINVTFIDNTSEATGGITNLKDYILNETIPTGETLRFPKKHLDEDVIPGILFRYLDSANREYFGWSNGIIIQLYDDEAILKTTVSLNSTIYRIDEVAEINVTIENIGDAIASGVQVQGFHAEVNADWEVTDIITFSDEVPLANINPGENVTYTFYRNVSTFLGIHPVAVVVDYITEENSTEADPFGEEDFTNLASNLINGIVLPKVNKEGEDVPSYPTPEINATVSWTDENGGNLTVGDVVEVRTEITNVGDEATTLKIYSYFPTRIAHINSSDTPYNGKLFKVTDKSGNTLTDYDYGFALDHPDWPISIAAIGGIKLAPNETIIFYYKVTMDNLTGAIIPPVHVEYDSRYPMAGTSGMEGGSDEEGSGIPASIPYIDESLVVTKDMAHFRLAADTGDEPGSKWSSYSGPTLLSAYSAVHTEETTSETSTSELPPEETTSGNETSAPASGFTTMTSSVPNYGTTITNFIKNNMSIMTVVLAAPIIAIILRERRRRQ